jgi:hypothetical protein
VNGFEYFSSAKLANDALLSSRQALPFFETSPSLQLGYQANTIVIDTGKAAMEVPGLGEVTKDEKYGWYYSKPIPVRMFDGTQCQIALEGYDGDECPGDFHVAIANFLSGTPAVLREADEPLFRYYKDFEKWWVEDGKRPIKSADELWQHVQLGNHPMVTRNRSGDQGIYISVECGCDWEEEHGLQLVLKNGLRVNKLGGYDGHLTNSDVFADERLEHVIYPALSADP